MNNRRITLLLLGIFILGSFLCAQSPELKARFLKRKPLINALKDQGKVGENNVGKLEPRAALNPEQTRLISAENADRETAYRAIARKLNVPPVEVGKRRAVKIAQLAKPGHWLQHPQGHWYRKK